MYAGLTTADKGALLDAKARGAEWVARDGKSRAFDLWFYSTKPVKVKNMWTGEAVFMEKKSARFAFIQWSDPEPVNIDLAIAQIAEMESKTETNEKCPICEYAISGCQCLYSGSAHPDRHDKKRVVLDHLYALSPEQVQHVISLEKHWQISYADEILNAILKKLLLSSPYTEGATDEG